MFERLMAVGRKRAEGQRARTIEQIAACVAEDVPAGVRVRAEEEGVVLSGHGLWRRWLSDARLRGIGLLMRETGR
jgi:hypothetical protein